MAAPEPTVTGNFPRKRFEYNSRDYTEFIREKVQAFENALANRSLNTSGIFLPKMEILKCPDTGNTMSSLMINVGVDSSGTTANVYKINTPGFFYVARYQGNWDPSGYIRILVSSNANFSPAYEYINTRGRKAAGTDTNNDHTTMIPIRPGTNTYVMVVGSFWAKDGYDLFFVPAWEYGGPYISDQGAKAVPTTVDTASGLDAGFKACFSV